MAAASGIKKSVFIVDGRYALDDNDVFGEVDFSGLKCNMVEKIFLAPPSKSIAPIPAATLSKLKASGFKIEELPSNRKKAACTHCHQNSALETLRDLDVAIATQLMVSAFGGTGIERILVFAGDGEFIHAINSIRSFSNVQIVGVGNRDTLSFKFEEVCDVVVWLDTINDLVRIDWESKGSKAVVRDNPNAQQRPPAVASSSSSSSVSSPSVASPSTSAAAAAAARARKTEDEALQARMLEMELAAEEQRIAQSQGGKAKRK